MTVFFKFDGAKVRQNVSVCNKSVTKISRKIHKGYIMLINAVVLLSDCKKKFVCANKKKVTENIL